MIQTDLSPTRRTLSSVNHQAPLLLVLPPQGPQSLNLVRPPLLIAKRWDRRIAYGASRSARLPFVLYRLIKLTNVNM
jgi:hypothetical protein